MSELTVEKEISENEKVSTKDEEGGEGGGEGGEGGDEKFVDDVTSAVFTPLVKLDAVEVVTHEEEEEVDYKQRSKCFEFGETLLNKGTGTKEWKERGIGDVKLLRHRESGRVRILMRQEKTMKVIINHFMDPKISLSPNGGSDSSFVWTAPDFAENSAVDKTFALKFKNADIAKEFKDAVTKAQADNAAVASGADSKVGEAEVDELSAKLESSVSVAEKDA